MAESLNGRKYDKWNLGVCIVQLTRTYIYDNSSEGNRSSNDSIVARVFSIETQKFFCEQLYDVVK